MLLDLTTTVDQDSPLIQWAKSQDNRHIAMGHVGTHLDTYEHSAIPLDYFKSRGVCFDVQGLAEVGAEDIDLGLIPEDAFVLFYTGQIDKHPYGDPTYFSNHPQLSQDLIRKLIDKNIRFIGIDCAGIRQHDEHEEADRFCEEHQVYVIENLQGLSRITDPEFMVYTMWLDDVTMTGLKCRVLVEQG